MRKKVFSILLSLAMVMAMILAMAVTTFATSAPESDFDFNAETGTITGYHGAGGDIEIPATIGGVEVKHIGECAFRWNKTLGKVTFAPGSKLETIQSRAFAECGITDITIPASVREIRASAFEQSDKMINVTIEDNSQLEIIGECAFFMTNITGFDMPESVKRIEYSAFACCDITEITLPAGLEYIGDAAFEGCIWMTKVTSKMITPYPIETFTFLHTALGAIYVPAESVEEYKKVWKQFPNMIKPIPDGISETETGGDVLNTENNNQNVEHATSAGTSPDTGDTEDAIIYGFTTLLALIGAGYVYRLRRKEEK